MNFKRIIQSGLLLVITCLGVFFLSSLISYFKVGADITDIFHVDESYYESHRPYVEWLEDDKEIYGAINEYIRNDIATAYVRAWKVLNLSFEQGMAYGLEDHFTKDQIKKINNNLGTTIVEQVDLSHHLKLHFLSLDKTVVSFTDTRAWMRKHINGACVDEENEFLVTMCLVDGKWLVNGITRKASEEKSKPKSLAGIKISRPSDMNGINYYPKNFPWMDFWAEYDSQLIEEDFRLMQSMDFKIVRFFIPFEIFGGAQVKTEMLRSLDHFVSTAALNKIYLMPCLFDFPVGYELAKYTAYDRQLETLLKRYADQEIIYAWDLKNELDRDFELQGRKRSLEWLDFVLSRARTYTSQPLTVGWSTAKFADIRSDQLDIISFHFYEDVEKLPGLIDGLQSKTSKPIVISEYGLSTYSGLWPGGSSVEEQQKLYTEISRITKKKKVSHIAWCLYDYEGAPSAVFGRKPWIKAKQKYFGLLDLEGNKKWK